LDELLDLSSGDLNAVCLHAVDFAKKAVLLPHDLTDKVKALSELVLFDSDFGVGCDGVEVLLDLEWNVLCQHLHRVGGATDVEAEVFVLDDAQKLSVTFLEEELALLLENRDIDITIS
jgi:hypothetical protein